MTLQHPEWYKDFVLTLEHKVHVEDWDGIPKIELADLCVYLYRELVETKRRLDKIEGKSLEREGTLR